MCWGGRGSFLGAACGRSAGSFRLGSGRLFGCAVGVRLESGRSGRLFGSTAGVRLGSGRVLGSAVGGRFDSG